MCYVQIGQVSEMFNLPVSTLRYYDKEGLFPFMQRASGIRQFSDTEIAALNLLNVSKNQVLKSRHQAVYGMVSGRQQDLRTQKTAF